MARRKDTVVRGWLAGVLLGWVLVAAAGADEARPQVAIIAHSGVPADTLSRQALLEFYTGDRRHWDDDQPVIVFDLKPKGPIKDLFYRHLGKSSSRMKSIWMKRMLSGEGAPPEAVDKEEEVVAKVALTPGAIGFVRSDRIGAGVKVLATIGGGGP